MKKFLIPFLFILNQAHAENVSVEQTKYLAKELNISNVIAAKKYFNPQNDKNYYLFLTEKKSSIPQKGLDNMDIINISAQYFEKDHDNFQLKWKIQDSINCYGVDISASFLPQSITFNAVVPHTGDIDNTEVTVGYTLFCGGGVDPKILKIIYRDHHYKYVLRGQTKIIFSHDPTNPIGGEMEMDSTFKKAPIAVQNHLKKLWKLVSIEKY